MRAASFGPTPVGARQRWPCPGRDRLGEIVGRQHAQDRQRQLGADALHGRQQAEPVALGSIGEAVEMDMILAHMGLDQEARPAPPAAGSRPSVRAEQKTR